VVLQPGPVKLLAIDVDVDTSERLMDAPFDHCARLARIVH
jgi:hypothetical protein